MSSSPTYRIRRRGALLLILACCGAAVAPVTGLGPVPARADDDGGGGSDGGGSDGGGDGGGSDDGGSDDGPGGGGASSSGSGGNGGSLQGSRDGDLAQRLKNRIVPVSQVEALANKVKPGEIIDVKLYRDQATYVYRVKVLQRSGSIYDLKFDAITRKLLSVRER